MSNHHRVQAGVHRGEMFTEISRSRSDLSGFDRRSDLEGSANGVMDD